MGILIRRKRATAIVPVVLGLAVLAAGCGGKGEEGSTTGNGESAPGNQGSAAPPAAPTGSTAGAPGFPVTVTDDAGQKVTLQGPPQRIVSLIPSMTETLFAIGVGNRVVADTEFDTYPPEALRLPQIKGMHPSAEQILTFHPDLVAAWSGNPPELLGALRRLGVPVYVSNPQTVTEVEQTVRTMGKLTGAGKAADQVADRMVRSVAEVEKAVQALHAPPVTGIVLSGYSPTYAAGPDSFVGDVFRLAGGRNLVQKSMGTFPQLSTESLLSLDPQTLFLTESGATAAGVAKRPGWNRLQAVRTGRVYVVNGDILNRPAPRIVQALSEIAHDLYPGMAGDKVTR